MPDESSNLTSLPIGEIGTRLVSALGNLEKSKSKLDAVGRQFEEVKVAITGALKHLQPIRDEMQRRLNEIEFPEQPVTAEVTPESPGDAAPTDGDQPAG